MKNQKVLVTGADGFIGSHLAEMLVRDGYPVRALTCYNSFNSWGWLDDSAFTKDMEIISGEWTHKNCRIVFR
jgi:dTDP-glucose 4,6-dehydratase